MEVQIHRDIIWYLKVWKRLTMVSFKVAFMSRLGAVLFTLGKFLRFGFLFAFIVVLVNNTKTLVGYSLNQVLIFYLVFNVLDSLTQLLFRDVYRFRQKVLSGDFDLLLVKPMSPLFRVLFGGADPLDIITLIPYCGFLIFISIGEKVSIISVLLFLLLFLNGFLIATAFHIAILALGILTTEIDHALMIYRDISGMGRFPPGVYHEFIRLLITFVIPIGIMVSFPAQALVGLLAPQMVLVSLAVGFTFFFLSILLWRYALTQYTSASS